MTRRVATPLSLILTDTVLVPMLPLWEAFFNDCRLEDRAATHLLSGFATLQKAVPPISELWIVVFCLHLVWQCGQIVMLDWPFETLPQKASHKHCPIAPIVFACACQQITRRNIGPNQVKNTKSKGLLARRGDTIGFANVASRLALAFLSFLESDLLSASMQTCFE